MSKYSHLGLAAKALALTLFPEEGMGVIAPSGRMAFAWSISVTGRWISVCGSGGKNTGASSVDQPASFEYEPCGHHGECDPARSRNRLSGGMRRSEGPGGGRLRLDPDGHGRKPEWPPLNFIVDLGAPLRGKADLRELQRSKEAYGSSQKSVLEPKKDPHLLVR